MPVEDTEPSAVTHSLVSHQSNSITNEQNVMKMHVFNDKIDKFRMLFISFIFIFCIHEDMATKKRAKM